MGTELQVWTAIRGGMHELGQHWGVELHPDCTTRRMLWFCLISENSVAITRRKYAGNGCWNVVDRTNAIILSAISQGFAAINSPDIGVPLNDTTTACPHMAANHSPHAATGSDGFLPACLCLQSSLPHAYSIAFHCPTCPHLPFCLSRPPLMPTPGSQHPQPQPEHRPSIRPSTCHLHMHTAD